MVQRNADPQFQNDDDTVRLCRFDPLSADNDQHSFSTLVTGTSVPDVISTCVEIATAFAEEKFGYSPVIEAMTCSGETPADQVDLVPPYLFFTVMELLKNSVVATVDRFGILDIEDAPPIQVGSGCTIVDDMNKLLTYKTPRY